MYDVCSTIQFLAAAIWAYATTPIASASAELILQYFSFFSRTVLKYSRTSRRFVETQNWRVSSMSQLFCLHPQSNWRYFFRYIYKVFHHACQNLITKLHIEVESIFLSAVLSLWQEFEFDNVSLTSILAARTFRNAALFSGSHMWKVGAAGRPCAYRNCVWSNFIEKLEWYDKTYIIMWWYMGNIVSCGS